MSENKPSSAAMQAAYDAWDRQDLDARADVPRNGATLLFKEAAEAFDQVWNTMLEQDAVTPEVLRLAREATQKAADGCLIAAVDPDTEPREGIVEQLPDGELQWRPR